MIKGYTYILSNKNKTVLYIGATKDSMKRLVMHKAGRATAFTKKYSVNELMYFEEYLDYHDAFAREKQLKNWRKDWKWNLIKSTNPELKDLYFQL